MQELEKIKKFATAGDYVAAKKAIEEYSKALTIKAEALKKKINANV